METPKPSGTCAPNRLRVSTSTQRQTRVQVGGHLSEPTFAGETMSQTRELSPIGSLEQQEHDDVVKKTKTRRPPSKPDFSTTIPDEDQQQLILFLLQILRSDSSVSKHGSASTLCRAFRGVHQMLTAIVAGRFSPPKPSCLCFSPSAYCLRSSVD